MKKQTAMQQLLNQMREERSKLPIPIEWDRAYQAIEMMIEHTYIPMEREQAKRDFLNGYKGGLKPMNHDVIDKFINDYYKEEKQ